ncbi:unnamed protein product, partial [Musa banksii]
RVLWRNHNSKTSTAFYLSLATLLFPSYHPLLPCWFR